MEAAAGMAQGLYFAGTGLMVLAAVAAAVVVDTAVAGHTAHIHPAAGNTLYYPPYDHT